MQLNQKTLEHLLHKQHLLNEVKEELEEHLPDAIDEGVRLLKEWLDTPSWPSKEARKDAIRHHDIRAIVLKMIANITMACTEALPLVSIASMSSMSDDLDKLDDIHLAAEVITVLADTDTYLLEQSAGGTYIVLSQLEPSESLQRKIRIGCYLPPMLDKPEKLYSNKDSAYLTIKNDKVILGGRLNQHSENVSLDVINLLNSQEYELDEHVIKQIKPFHRDVLDEQGLSELTVEEQKDYQKELKNYHRYLEQFQFLSTNLVGRKLHFTHKPDKRGRMYTQGFHFNPMGSSYEKACINLYNKETVTGEL